MNVRLYQCAYEWKHGAPLDRVRVYGLTQAESFLRQDMAANKVAWTGHFLSDLAAWTKNSNPLVAMFASHLLHPISRLERYYIFCLQVLLFAYIAILLARIDECDDYFHGGGECGAHRTIESWHLVNRDPTMDYQDSTASQYCCELNMQALLAVRRELSPSRNAWAGAYAAYLPVAGLAATVALLNIVLGQVWFLLAGCQCCQRSARRQQWECLGHAILLLCGLAPLTYSLWLIGFFRGRMAETAMAFAQVKLLSVCGSTVVQTLTFTLLWRAEVRGGRGERTFHLTVRDIDAYRQEHARRVKEQGGSVSRQENWASREGLRMLL
jgi:hypothetical protein